MWTQQNDGPGPTRVAIVSVESLTDVDDAFTSRLESSMRNQHIECGRNAPGASSFDNMMHRCDTTGTGDSTASQPQVELHKSLVVGTSMLRLRRLVVCSG